MGTVIWRTTPQPLPQPGVVGKLSRIPSNNRRNRAWRTFGFSSPTALTGGTGCRYLFLFPSRSPVGAPFSSFCRLSPSYPSPHSSFFPSSPIFSTQPPVLNAWSPFWPWRWPSASSSSPLASPFLLSRRPLTTEDQPPPHPSQTILPPLRAVLS